MKVDEKTAEAISSLARLNLTELDSQGNRQDVEKLVEEFNKIVGYMDILSEVDTTGVEPLYSPMLCPQSPREDIPSPPDEERFLWILDDAPETFGRFFKVPKVL
ncbi:MAG: Asp-tRNA(Asn)/Glu-tRNA(Gln) amidotransferase subunit GatC [Deltaproteobacteria bacterium]|jgi:aspartyl-tRNA(Asn)/glutamyl-tRNA(Gln) amidotransferase subunit C|nr:Asp-tRNA(Asn)/Glu-tRNA(Gln) amidotransferase subunit GatC [Deltaproteobacteria bacterium]